MAKRRSTRKQKKKNNQLIIGAVGILIVAAVIFGIIAQNNPTKTAELPAEINTIVDLTAEFWEPRSVRQNRPRGRHARR